MTSSLFFTIFTVCLCPSCKSALDDSLEEGLGCAVQSGRWRGEEAGSRVRARRKSGCVRGVWCVGVGVGVGVGVLVCCVTCGMSEGMPRKCLERNMHTLHAAYATPRHLVAHIPPHTIPSHLRRIRTTHSPQPISPLLALALFSRPSSPLLFFY